MAATTRKASKPAPVRPRYEDSGLPLEVDIFKDGKLVRSVTLPDPRVAFCAAIDSLGVGLTARMSEAVVGEKMEGGAL